MHPHLISYLTGSFPYSAEFQAFFMALQGAMIVRTGPNKNGSMQLFHAFAQGVVISYAGGLFAPFWMGNPTPFLGNDVHMTMCILAFIVVNFMPYDLGFKIGKLFPVRLITTMGAELFRTMGMIKFVDIAYNALKDSPSSLYPTPIWGPILNGTILGNMGGFFWNGFQGYLKGGMPIKFQNAFLWTTLYHFIANDDEIIGQYIRSVLSFIPQVKMGMSDKIFVIVLTSLFAQSVAILQMVDFLGPSFHPINALSSFGSNVLFTRTKPLSKMGKKAMKKKKNHKTN